MKGVDETGLHELFNTATDAIIVLDAHPGLLLQPIGLDAARCIRPRRHRPSDHLPPTPLPASDSDAGGRHQLLLRREGFEPLPARSCAIAMP